MAIEQSFFDELEKVDIIYYNESRAYFNKNRLDQYLEKAKKYDELVPLLQELTFKFSEDSSLGSYEIHLYELIESILNGGVGTQ